ncbi:two-component sensor histidine kinase [Solibacillus sp. R5-41]|uniref:sensor histidine kinase n=1 Tax=Solibacillus sp. R5-41 TaxID=2048654 RepID=UPI000C126C98|nr:HAMP domain-containing sensor histidine kinase [Solibacillus sp. R5-41]ATP41764.1 two-component sensor histidine kinase [Solibacillus sp. R5-41]
MKKLSSKIWLLIVLFLSATVVFMYIFTDFLYEHFYVEDTKIKMVEVGEKLQTMYKGGKVTDELIDAIDNYAAYSNIPIFAVRNPRELSACVPFDVDYDALIGPAERQQLIAGNAVIKIGFEKRFERQIISVILPFTDQNRLEGIIYLYYPLAKISELAKEEVVLLITGAVMFLLVATFFVYQGMRKILRPLANLQQAVNHMAQGEYATRVDVTSKDEIGTLSTAFNQMAQSIQREDEAQKSFLATVSHELRTPISYVKGYSEAIQNGYISDQKRDEAIGLIARESARMERLTNELMQLARKDEKIPLSETEPLVLAETIRDAVSLLQNQAIAKRIQIEQSLEEELIVMGDEEKIKQVFINVIENAVRYSQENAAILIHSKEIGSDAVITVTDSGIGIPAEDLPHITERFYRVNKARSRSDGGSGLGLSIVEQIVKQHHGKLKIESTLAKGTDVIITLPIMEES